MVKYGEEGWRSKERSKMVLFGGRSWCGSVMTLGLEKEVGLKRI